MIARFRESVTVAAPYQSRAILAPSNRANELHARPLETTASRASRATRICRSA